MNMVNDLFINFVHVICTGCFKTQPAILNSSRLHKFLINISKSAIAQNSFKIIEKTHLVITDSVHKTSSMEIKLPTN